MEKTGECRPEISKCDLCDSLATGFVGQKAYCKKCLAQRSSTADDEHVKQAEEVVYYPLHMLKAKKKDS